MGRREHLDRASQQQPTGLDIKRLQRELAPRAAVAPNTAAPSASRQGRAPRFMIGRLLCGSNIVREVAAAYAREGVHLNQPAALVYIDAEAARLAAWKHFSVSPNTYRHTAALLGMVETRFGDKSKYLHRPIPVEIGPILLQKRARGSEFSHRLGLGLINNTVEQKHEFNELRFQRRDMERVVVGSQNIVPPAKMVVSLGSVALTNQSSASLREVNESLSRLMPESAELGPVQVIEFNR